jgi:hypothetical protein
MVQQPKSEQRKGVNVGKTIVQTLNICLSTRRMACRIGMYRSPPRNNPEGDLMSRFTSWAARAARSLSAHLDRLHQTLDRLHDRLREAVAEAVGGGAAVAVKDAIVAAMLFPDVAPTYEPPRYHTASRPYEQQRYRDGSYASENPYRSSWERDPYDEDPDPYEPDDDPPSEASSPQPSESLSRRFGQAIAVGCQTAAWWLRRKRSGRYASLLAIVVGAAASVAAYFAGPVVATAAALAASAMSLNAMADVARRGAAILGGVRSS